MVFSLPLYQARGYGSITATAGTAIVRCVEPVLNAFTRLTQMSYTAAGTAHTITIMRPKSLVTTTAVAAAAQAVINISADPGIFSTTYSGGTSRVADRGIAANDYIVYQIADGTYVVDTVASVSTLAITMTTNVPTGGTLSGAPFWFFGLTTDKNPADGNAHPTFTAPASATTHWGVDPGEGIAGFIGTLASPSFFTNMNGKFQPLIIYSNNATAAGTLERCTAVYSSK